MGPGWREGICGLASGSDLIGRDNELSRLRGLVDPPPAESRVLVLLGDPGMGKTVLLAEAARQARSARLRVLSVTGRESEKDLGGHANTNDELVAAARNQIAELQAKARGL